MALQTQPGLWDAMVQSPFLRKGVESLQIKCSRRTFRAATADQLNKALDACEKAAEAERIAQSAVQLNPLDYVAQTELQTCARRRLELTEKFMQLLNEPHGATNHLA